MGQTNRKPMKWEAFLQLSEQEQIEYLQFVLEEFHVGIALVARDVFHVSRNTLQRHMTKLGLQQDGKAGGRIPEIMLAKWRAWVQTGELSEHVLPYPASRRTEQTVSQSEQTLRETIRTMQELYGSVRVTITIEPANAPGE